MMAVNVAKNDSWQDLIKLARSALYEKRHIVIADNNERSQIQKFLDIIQKSIKITSLQSMMERLETITRQMGLKFTTGPTGNEFFISSDMFYVEVVLNPENGKVNEVKIAHQGEPVSCPEIIDILNNSDFPEFTKHLDGLASIYQLNADKKQKTKAYLALHALETDLTMLAQLQSSIIDPNNLVHKSPVGILEPRKGGHPMKLTYFVSPYDLLDLKTKSPVPLTVDVVIKKKLGYSVSVCMESSSPHKLQTISLISVTKTTEGKNLPQFAALSNLNSSTLPACFVLRLPSQLAMSLETLRKIQSITGIDVVSNENLSKCEPLVNLIAKRLLSDNDVKQRESYHGPYYVKLPDQSHSYYMNESLGGLEGVEVSSIPFTHPTYVPQILIILRQQVLFNVVIASCIRGVNEPKTNVHMFEVAAVSMSIINVSFEHPTEESLATIEFDLRDITNVKCKLYDSNSFSSLCTDEHASKIMQRCLSIPVTMRGIFAKCQEKAAALKEEQSKQQARLLQQVSQSDIYFNSLNSNGESGEYMQDSLPPYLSQQLLSNQYQEQPEKNGVGAYDSHSSVSSAGHSGNGGLYYTLHQRMNLQQHHSGRPQGSARLVRPQGQKQNAMLMSMLSDVPAANSQSGFIYSQGMKKPQRKRKAEGSRSPGSATGRSPKRKVSEDDFSKDSKEGVKDFIKDGGEVSSEGYGGTNANYDVTRMESRPYDSRSIDSMLSIKQEPAAETHQDGNYQYMNRSLSFPGPTTGPGSGTGPGPGPGSEINNFNGEYEISGAVKKKLGKRKFDEEIEDGANEQQLILNSLNDLHAYDTESNSGKFLSPSPKGPRKSGSEVRRCSSAGGEGNYNKRLGGNSDDLKKERKRKRAESVDGIKMAVSSTVSGMLMPPPMITSSGEVAGKNCGFVEVCSNGAPALRPLTLNVKPMVASSTTNGPLKVKKSGVSSSGLSPKAKIVDKIAKKTSPKEECEPNGTNFSPKSSPKIASSKNIKILKSSLQGAKGLKVTGLKLKSSNTPSSSNAVGINVGMKGPVTISSPMSSSLSNLPSSTMPQTKTGLVQKVRRQSSLNAVIDKLTRVNTPGSEGDIVPKSEDVPSRPDSSSSGGRTGVSSTGTSKLSESKVKYSRSSDQFTMKPISGGTLKFTVTKTKPSSTMPEFKAKKGLGLVKTTLAVSGSGTKSSKVPGTGLKRAIGFKGTPYKQGVSPSVSSPKGGSPKSNMMRVTGGKVSSSNNSKSKISSSDAILDAIPRIRIDHLPKIPRTNAVGKGGRFQSTAISSSEINNVTSTNSIGANVTSTSTSTPSSPVECSIDGAPPPLIPMEAVDERASSSNDLEEGKGVSSSVTGGLNLNATAFLGANNANAFMNVESYTTSTSSSTLTTSTEGSATSYGAVGGSSANGTSFSSSASSNVSVGGFTSGNGNGSNIITQSSPYLIDDDLMDEALVGSAQ